MRAHFKLAMGMMLILLIALQGCGVAPVTETPSLEQVATPSVQDALILSPVEMRAGFGAQSDWLGVYFTDPFSNYADEIEGGPDELLAEAILNARSSVDVTVYSFSLWSIRDALLKAHQKGVAVRVVVHGGNLRDDEIQDLVRAGIPYRASDGKGLMHNKFVIIDRQEVWTGSMNFTVSSGYRGNNNLVRVRSSALAEAYLTEFNEMFEDNFFGENIVRNTPANRLEINGMEIEIYFSPDDQPADRIEELLYSAQKSIYFMAFSFTSDDFAEAIRLRSDAGVLIRGVMEDDQIRSNQGTEYDLFRQLGLLVYPDGNPGDMHHKVFIIDEKIVITGSYNFSRSAETRNDENVLIIHSPEVATHFLVEFARVLSKVKP